MAITKEKKNKIVREIKDKLEQQKSMIFVDFTGLDASQILDLRKKIKEAGCQIKVIKKNLFRVALREKGNSLWQQVKKIPGQLAVIFGFEEDNKSPKITYKFSQENENLQILGGYLHQEYKRPEEVEMIAKLPSREELLANITNVIAVPASKFVHALKANLQNLVYLLSQIKKRS